MDQPPTNAATATGTCCSTGLSRGQANLPVGASGGSRAARIPDRAVRIDGGRRVRIGEDDSPLPQDGESPSRVVAVKPFAIDPFAVTNAWFAAFVSDTAYRTDAERFGWSLVFKDFVPSAPPDPAMSGAPTWWRKIDGACWRHPEGPASSIADRADHPVVHVSWNDAVAFAAWAGGRLPDEAEWECAARGTLQDARFPWGDGEPDDSDFQPCNIWQGEFPTHNACKDGFAGTAPVGSFAPNSVGLFNMVGNAWEWCADAFRVRSLARHARLRNEAAQANAERVLKGGSYLCHRSYCYRYRIAARTGVSPDSSTGHVGFRLAFDV